MSADEKIDAVLSARDAYQEAEQRRDEAMAVLREATQEALSSGAGATALAKAAGVPRTRIYKWASKDYR